MSGTRHNRDRTSDPADGPVLYGSAFLFVLLLGITITARAEELPCRTAKAVGSYKDPTTGAIEDDGKE